MPAWVYFLCTCTVVVALVGLISAYILYAFVT